MFRIAYCAAKASLFVVVALALNAPAIGQTENATRHDLHVKTPKGTTVWFVTSATNEQATKIRTMAVKVAFQVRRTFRITIKQVNAKGHRIIELYIARVAGWTQRNDGAKTPFDTALDGTDARNPQMRRILAAAGRRYTARIDVNGKLIGSMDGIEQQMRGKDPQTDVQDWELADLAETAFGRTPDKPTAIGDTWSFIQSGSSAIPTDRHATLQLTKVTDSTFEMELSGTVKKGQAPAAAKGEAPNGAGAKDAARHRNMTISNAKVTGKQIVSRQDGLVIETESKSVMDLVIDVDGQNNLLHAAIKTRLTRTTKPVIKPRKQRTPKVLAEQAITRTMRDAKMIAGAVRNYYVRNHALPDSLEDLAMPDARGRGDLQELPRDPWGNPYKLNAGATPPEFQVISAGLDKRFDTEDDISNRTTYADMKLRNQKLPKSTLAARIAKSQTDVKLLADAVRIYFARTSKLPESLAVLAEKDKRGRSQIEELPKDSWGQPYELAQGDTPREFQVISTGPDKRYGTDDDISSRTKRR